MNILPKFQKDELKKGYTRRSVILALWASFFTFILCTLFMLPVYIISYAKLNDIKTRQTANSNNIDDEKDILNAPRIINNKATLVIQSANNDSVSSKVIAVAEVKDFGVVLNRLSYAETGKEKKPIYRITIGGVAPTRDALINFEKAVKELSFVKDANIPVSDFARDKDLTFSMSINILNQ